ncbi:MAG: glycosyltransferase [Verrucomicrobia bacterium]|nr:glycosyltransferase [Verrucomicrobiota bacterium]MCH8514222.1 glycosyltransferase [Kiritimatiellia bacterium]
MKPKMLLYGLAWHLEKSDAVLEALIRPLAPWLEIELVPWDGEHAPRPPSNGEAVGFFQFPPPWFDPDWRRTPLTWIPMWDHSAAQNRNPDWWRGLPACWKIVAFSDEVAQLAAGRQHVLKRVFYRDPATRGPVDWTGPRTLYYWNRVGLVGPEFLRRLCESCRIDRLLFRPDLDPKIPEGRRYDLPGRLGHTEVERVPFYENKAQYDQQLEQVNILLAPRPLEGIGLVMLDGMAKGAAVLAAPYATATNYIRHGENGVLFARSRQDQKTADRSKGAWWTIGDDFLLSDDQDWEGLKGLDFKALGEKARRDAKEGYEHWAASLQELAAFLLAPAAVPESCLWTGPLDGDPLVSVCVPHLNSMPFTRERIQSIREQSWKNWECVVVDSGSTDGSLELWREAADEDPRIRLFDRPREGIYPAFNESIRLSSGDYVYIATADDTLHARGIEAMARALIAHPDCGLCHTPLIAIDEQGHFLKSLEYWNAGFHVLGKWAYLPHIRKAPYDALVFGLYGSMYLSVTQLMYTREALKQTGDFSSEYGNAGDFAFHLRLGAGCNTVYLPENYGTWRWHDEQASSHTANWQYSWQLWEMVRDAWPRIMAPHGELANKLPACAPGLRYRLQAFTHAVYERPPYLQRGRAILRALARDPGLISQLRRGTWHRDLGFNFPSQTLAFPFLEDCSAEDLIQPL